MAKLDPKYAHLHKQIYQRCLDELDTEVVHAIMSNPNCEEAVLLNARVEAEMRERIQSDEKLVLA